ncbi:hypothetical protein SMC26_11855 [Actinomadura fulvescens]|uniref:Uncharacterized protein n=1 Tax=Actinomadura fulvescens TaxID=46160 RepID=A0ABP6BQG6_9ACTN
MLSRALRTALVAAAAALTITGVTAAGSPSPRSPAAHGVPAAPGDPCYRLDRPYWPPTALRETCQQCNQEGLRGAVAGEWDQWKRMLDRDLNIWELYTWEGSCPRCRVNARSAGGVHR